MFSTSELEHKKAAQPQPIVPEEEHAEEENEITNGEAIEATRSIIKKPKYLSQSFSTLKPSQIEQPNNLYSFPKTEHVSDPLHILILMEFENKKINLLKIYDPRGGERESDFNLFYFKN